MLKKLIFLFAFTVLNSCGGGKEIDPNLRSINDIYTQRPNYNIDISYPTNNQLFNSLSSSNIQLNGTCSEEGLISVKINDINVQESQCLSLAFTAPITLSSLNEGENIISVSYSQSSLSTDVAIIKDTVIPSLSIVANQINQSNEQHYILQGTCSEENSTINGTLDALSFYATCTNNTFSSSVFDLSFLADGNYSAQAVITDQNGNISEIISQSIEKDTTTPLPILSFINPISAYGNDGDVDIQISNINSGDEVFIYTDSNCAGPILYNAISSSSELIINLSTSNEGQYTYYFTVPAQSSSLCLGPLTYTEDLTDPTGVDTITMSSPQSGETTSDATPLFTGTISSIENGSYIYIYRDISCSEQEVGLSTVEQGSFTVGASLALDGSHQGFNEFYLKVIDQAGNSSDCLPSNLSYTLSNTGLASLPKIALVGDNAISKLISLEDNTTVTWIKKSDSANPITFGPLSKGEILYIEDPDDSSIKVNTGDIVESTGPTYIVSQGYGTAPWATEAYSGKKFTSYQYRYGAYSKIFVTSLVSDSLVQVKQDTNNDGQLETIAYSIVPKNEVVEFSPTIIDGKPFQIVSNYDINAYYVSSSNTGLTYDKDARVLTPAAKDIIGFSWNITSLENDTSLSAYRHEVGLTYTNSDLDINENFDIGRTLKSSLINFAARVTSDKPVSMLQIADQDGVNATPSLPINMLATDYGIVANADYIGIIAPLTGNYYYTLPGESEVGPIALTPPGNTSIFAPYAAFFDNAGLSVPAGTLIRCDTPCFMMYDDIELGDSDETLMMGFTP